MLQLLSAGEECKNKHELNTFMEHLESCCCNSASDLMSPVLAFSPFVVIMCSLRLPWLILKFIIKNVGILKNQFGENINE